MFASHFKLLCHLDSRICVTMFLLSSMSPVLNDTNPKQMKLLIPIYVGKIHPEVLLVLCCNDFILLVRDRICLLMDGIRANSVYSNKMHVIWFFSICICPTINGPHTQSYSLLDYIFEQFNTFKHTI